jgi:phage regulator Rha-like protein
MVDEIMLLILEAAPSIAAVASVIIACVKLIKKFNELKGEVIQTKEYKEIKRELAASHRENVELKKQISELLTKIDRVERK